MPSKVAWGQTPPSKVETSARPEDLTRNPGLETLGHVLVGTWDTRLKPMLHEDGPKGPNSCLRRRPEESHMISISYLKGQS